MASILGKITVIKRNGTSGSQYPLTNRCCTFGRNAECEIRIQLPTVSEQECKLEIDENGNFILSKINDVGELFLNDDMVGSCATVYHKDVLKIAGRSFRFEYPPTNEKYRVLLSAKKMGTPKPKMIERVRQSQRMRVSFGPQLSPEQFVANLPPNTPIKKGGIPMIQNSFEDEMDSCCTPGRKTGLSKKNTPASARNTPATDRRKSRNSLNGTPTTKAVDMRQGKGSSKKSTPTSSRRSTNTPARKTEISEMQGVEETNAQPISAETQTNEPNKIGTPSSNKKRRSSNVGSSIKKATPSSSKKRNTEAEILDLDESNDQTIPLSAPQEVKQNDASFNLATPSSTIRSTNISLCIIETPERQIYRGSEGQEEDQDNAAVKMTPASGRKSSKTPAKAAKTPEMQILDESADLFALDESGPQEDGWNAGSAKKATPSSSRRSTNTPAKKAETPKIMSLDLSVHDGSVKKGTPSSNRKSPKEPETPNMPQSFTEVQVMDEDEQVEPRISSVKKRRSSKATPSSNRRRSNNADISAWKAETPKMEDLDESNDQTIPWDDLQEMKQISSVKKGTPSSNRKGPNAPETPNLQQSFTEVQVMDEDEQVEPRISSVKKRRSSKAAPSSNRRRSNNADISAWKAETPKMEDLDESNDQTIPWDDAQEMKPNEVSLSQATPSSTRRSTNISLGLADTPEMQSQQEMTLESSVGKATPYTTRRSSATPNWKHETPKMQMSFEKSEAQEENDSINQATPCSSKTAKDAETPEMCVYDFTDDDSAQIQMTTSNKKSTPSISRRSANTPTWKAETPKMQILEESMDDSVTEQSESVVEKANVSVKEATPSSTRRKSSSLTPKTPEAEKSFKESEDEEEEQTNKRIGSAKKSTPSSTRRSTNTPKVKTQKMQESLDQQVLVEDAPQRDSVKNATPSSSRRSAFAVNSSRNLETPEMKDAVDQLSSDVSETQKTPQRGSVKKATPSSSRRSGFAETSSRNLETPKMESYEDAEDQLSSDVSETQKNRSVKKATPYSARRRSTRRTKSFGRTKHALPLWSEIVKMNKMQQPVLKNVSDAMDVKANKKHNKFAYMTPEQRRQYRHINSPATIYIGRAQRKRKSNIDLESPVDDVKARFEESINGDDSLEWEEESESSADEDVVSTPNKVEKDGEVKEHFGTKRLLKTPREAKKNEEVKEHFGTKRLLKTPKEKIKHEAVEEHFGTKRLLRTPREARKNEEVTEHFGTKRLLKTPKEKKSEPVGEYFGTKRLFKTPKEKKNEPVEEHFGTKRLMQTPRAAKVGGEVTEHFGTKRLLTTPPDRKKYSPVEEHFGTKRLLRTPRATEKNEEVSEYFGTKRLLQTPREKLEMSLMEDYCTDRLFESPQKEDDETSDSVEIPEDVAEKILDIKPTAVKKSRSVKSKARKVTTKEDISETEVTEASDIEEPETVVVEQKSATLTSRSKRQKEPVEKSEVKVATEVNEMASEEKPDTAVVEQKSATRTSRSKRQKEPVEKSEVKVATEVNEMASEEKPDTAVVEQKSATRPSRSKRPKEPVEKSEVKVATEVNEMASEEKPDTAVVEQKSATRPSRSKRLKEPVEKSEVIKVATEVNEMASEEKPGTAVVEQKSATRTSRSKRQKEPVDKLEVKVATEVNEMASEEKPKVQKSRPTRSKQKKVLTGDEKAETVEIPETSDKNTSVKKTRSSRAKALKKPEESDTTAIEVKTTRSGRSRATKEKVSQQVTEDASQADKNETTKVPNTRTTRGRPTKSSQPKPSLTAIKEENEDSLKNEATAKPPVKSTRSIRARSTKATSTQEKSNLPVIQEIEEEINGELNAQEKDIDTFVPEPKTTRSKRSRATKVSSTQAKVTDDKAEAEEIVTRPAKRTRTVMFQEQKVSSIKLKSKGSVTDTVQELPPPTKKSSRKRGLDASKDETSQIQALIKTTKNSEKITNPAKKIKLSGKFAPKAEKNQPPQPVGEKAEGPIRRSSRSTRGRKKM